VSSKDGLPIRPAVALACAKIEKKHENTVVVLPSVEYKQNCVRGLLPPEGTAPSTGMV